jgi:hypothetical protein
VKRKLSLLSTVVPAMTAPVVALTPGAASAATPTDGHTYWIVNAKSDMEQRRPAPGRDRYTCGATSTNDRWVFVQKS